jgi:hypothetical protein
MNEVVEVRHSGKALCKLFRERNIQLDYPAYAQPQNDLTDSPDIMISGQGSPLQRVELRLQSHSFDSSDQTAWFLPCLFQYENAKLTTKHESPLLTRNMD